MYKSCLRCGRIHNINHICNVGRPKRKYKIYLDVEDRKMRNTTSWVHKSLEIKSKSNFLCEVCKDDGVYNYKCLEVHHIDKIKEEPTKFLDDDNLITLCVFHHKLADKGMLEKEYLRNLVRNRDKKL